MATKKLRIGDVCEVQTLVGLAYVQYTHDGKDMGQLVRVLPGLYPSRPNIAELVKQRELYFVFYTLQIAIKSGQTLIVTNQPVPDWAKPYPPMRNYARRAPDGKMGWQIIDASTPFTVEVLSRIPVVHTLTPEQKRLSIHGLWPPPVMEKQLARGWTPARAEEFDLKDLAEHEAQQAQNPPKPTPNSERLRHYLYFPQKANAEKAAQWFRSQGFVVDVRLGADRENWLALVKHGPLENAQDIEKLRDEMEALAERLNGAYDGWEVAV